jgi:hypothetical protein
MDSKKFIKYLKTIDFPNNNYNAVKLYPGTELVNGKYINDFNKKYKKKYLHIHEDKNLLENNIVAKQLFNNSLSYISKIQNNLLNIKIDNYISGGAALKLYSLKDNSLTKSNSDVLLTKDVDLYLYYDDKKITNKIILTNVFKIIDSVLLTIKDPNFAFLELYIIINFENTKKFKELIEIMYDNSFELFLYKKNKGDEEDVYSFNFIKVINKEFCIRLKIKFKKIDNFIKENIFSYTKLTYYYIKKISDTNFKVINKNIPIEILIKNKNKSNLELMKSTLNLHNNIFYIYNENTLLYNLMHLYYKYKFNTEDITISVKKESGKNVRDEKRLNIFFKIYCNSYYKNLNNSNKNSILDKLKNNCIKFKDSIEKIKNFDGIDKIFNQ